MTYSNCRKTFEWNCAVVSVLDFDPSGWGISFIEYDGLSIETVCFSRLKSPFVRARHFLLRQLQPYRRKRNTRSLNQIRQNTAFFSFSVSTRRSLAFISDRFPIAKKMSQCYICWYRCSETAVLDLFECWICAVSAFPDASFMIV